MQKDSRFRQDESGQWWYHFGKKNPCRCRAYPKTCEQCGKEFIQSPIKRQDGVPVKHCSRECGVRAAYERPEVREQFKGEKSHLWKGGKVMRRGYVFVHAPDHPSCQGNQKRYVAEHRLVMENVEKRFLKPHEQVHHRNGDRADNRPENLELWQTHQPPGQRVHEQKHCPTCTCNEGHKHD